MQNTNRADESHFLEGRYNWFECARFVEQNIWVTVGFALNRQQIGQKYLEGVRVVKKGKKPAGVPIWSFKMQSAQI